MSRASSPAVLSDWRNGVYPPGNCATPFAGRPPASSSSSAHSSSWVLERAVGQPACQGRPFSRTWLAPPAGALAQVRPTGPRTCWPHAGATGPGHARVPSPLGGSQGRSLTSRARRQVTEPQAPNTGRFSGTPSGSAFFSLREPLNRTQHLLDHATDPKQDHQAVSATQSTRMF